MLNFHLHKYAQVGDYIAQRDYGISDPDILQAISFHQSGGVGMTVRSPPEFFA
jgi:HD superfamily phosphohydrolase YqeK